MQIFQSPIAAIRHLIRSYTGEVSLLVAHLTQLLHEKPESFELVGSGSALVIRRKNDPEFVRIRLEPYAMSLQTPLLERFELTSRERRILVRAVHKWLD